MRFTSRILLWSSSIYNLLDIDAKDSLPCSRANICADGTNVTIASNDVKRMIVGAH